MALREGHDTISMSDLEFRGAGMDDEILVKDLPHELNESVVHAISAYTVAFVRVEERNGRRHCTLLGSGVLIAAAGVKAILTAHHVVQVLPKTGRLCVMLEKTSEPHTLDTAGLVFLPIARGSRDADGPDLGAVVLAPHLAGSIAAKKVFFNLDRRRDELLSEPPNVRDGVWFAQGFLEERTVATEDPDGGTTTRFYNFSGIGGPDGPVERGGYDYYEYPVTHESRSEAPVSWGGMSGGGVWRVPLGRENGQVVPRHPVLSGVLFYQRPTTATECGVVAHGPRSVYRVAYNSIVGEA